MPADVAAAIRDAGLKAAYDARPPYQRNHHIGWIERAAREETRHRHIAQRLDELRPGDVYMKMFWRPRPDHL